MKQNLHTHTTWCDGIDTPEEMIGHALSKGFDSLGFSGHSPNPWSTYTHVTEETTRAYREEILRLKQRYSDKIKLYLGLEVEICGSADLQGYDYLIGAVHYLPFGQEWVAFDRSAASVRELIDTRFGGDGMAFARKYFETASTMPQYGNFDIIGHFDIHTKHIETLAMFDMEDKRYLAYATDAMDALRGKIPLFEVNTGAMARGYRTAPYPTATLLREFRKRGFGAVISSDCHDGRCLDFGFDAAEALLRECGFRERYVLTDAGFVAVGLQEGV